MAEKITRKFINSFLGMWTSRASDEIPDGWAANSRNCDHSDPASLQPSGGYSIFGTEGTASNQEILSLFKYIKKDGSTKVLLRVRDDGSNSILEWLNTVDTGNSVDGEWEILNDTFTTGKRMSFWEIPNTTNDYLAMGNGTDNFSLWTGAFASIASSAAGVITLNEASATGAGFAAAGGIISIGGTEYTYTSATGATLLDSGNGFPVGVDANTGVAEAVDDATYSDRPKTNVGTVCMSRLWLAEGIRLYYSKIGTAGEIAGATFTAGNDAADPGFTDVMGGEGDITAIAEGNGWIFPMKKDFIEQYRISLATAASSTTQYKYPERRTVGKGDGIGPGQQQALTYVDNVPYYFTTGGGIKKLVGVGTDRFDVEDITDLIRPTIEDGDFGTAAVTYFDNKKVILASYKNSSDSAANDKTLAIWIRREETGLRANSISILDWFSNDYMTDENKLYMASSFDNNVYTCFDGFSAVDAPYTSIYSLKRLHYGAPFIEKKFVGGYLPIEGMISAGTTLKFELDYDEGGSRQHSEATFKDTDDGYIIAQAVNTIGAFELGNEPLGGTLKGVDELDFFRVFFTLPGVSFYNIQLTISCATNGSKWKVTKVGLDAELADYVVSPARKKTFQI